MKNALLLSLLCLPGVALGQTQRTTAQAFGVSVTTSSINQQTPAAVAPADGMAQNESSDITMGSMVTAQNAYAVASGSSDRLLENAVGNASLGTVVILDGLITATGVVAIATSTPDGDNFDGSSVSNLVVNGVAMSAPAPNTRVDLPDVGYVILNEQISTRSGITVNMIHVVLDQNGRYGAGEIIVGSASSNVK